MPCPTLRDASLVLVTGIVGVPWQDIAANPNDLTQGYKTAKQLHDDGVWGDIVGDPLNPAGPVAPRDVHIVRIDQAAKHSAGPRKRPECRSQARS